ncbi:MAG: HAMP domain-containing sensor histidine kinase [Vicinamibacterales bacterium]
MLQSTVGVAYRPRPWRLLAWFLAAVALVWLTGRSCEYRGLGRTDDEGRRLIADRVRQEFDGLRAELERAAAAASQHRDLMLRAPRDRGAARELFAELAAISDASIAMTVYGSDAAPLAWSGRPSELPGARLAGPPALLVAPGASGLRLVLVHPVPAAGEQARQAGTIVAEAGLPTGRSSHGLGTEALTWTSAPVPVSIRPGYEGGLESRSTDAFVLADLAGRALLEGRVQTAHVASARATIRDRTLAGLAGLTALFLAWLTVPLLAWKGSAQSPKAVLARSAVLAAIIASARGMAWIAVPLAGAVAPLSGQRPLPAVALLWMRSPADFLLTSIACLMGVLLVSDLMTRLRLGLRRARVSPADTWQSAVTFGLIQLLAGIAAVALLAWYLRLGNTLAAVAGIDWLRYSLHPWEGGRLAIAAGLVCMHAAAVWGAVALLRFSEAWWRIRSSTAEAAGLVAAWALPAVMWMWWPGGLAGAYPAWVLLPPALLTVALAWGATRLLHWRRHSSQAASLLAMFLGLALPAVTFYPAAGAQADRTKRQVVETRLAPQAIGQRDEVQATVRRAMLQVDAVPGLIDLVRSQAPPAAGQVPTEYAFLVWSQTDLAASRLTSAVELYDEAGALTSRFALNLPEYTQAQQRWQEASCEWEVFEEVSPFGSEERRLLHAGRGLCVSDGGRTRMVGTLVIHAMLDYGSLPFITSQNPYVELFQSRPSFSSGHSLDRDVGFVVYGWSLTPIYASSPWTWTLDAETFRRVYASRTPFWTRRDEGGRRDHVYLANDRGGIYALGYPAISTVGHLVALAELVTLSGAVFVLLTLLRSAGRAAAGVRGERGRDLLHEIRASFYRKLFLAFVAVAVIPVLTLAFVARAYMMVRLRADVEEAAIRTTTVAQRFVEDSSRIQERGEGAAIILNDDAIVGISRVIDQDVNVYDGPRLVATSERDLFASGLLPTRTAADVYRAIVLDRRAAYVGEERLGQFPYMVAAAPLKIAGANGLITVPLTLRQRAIDREIDALNRRILLGVLAFILIGSALGYWMAERIADPVNRLQRATARLARGDLDARVVVTSSDELRRLVEAFNSMAAELQRQQAALERTHRLEAWADMARQVAHEIKNPLTPVQLSAEHLRRVHADRGKPLSPVLEECVDSILSQVRLLRQIAGEFSSFAASPTPRPVETSPADLVAEVLEPYRAGLPAGVTLSVDVPGNLPDFQVDRSLLGRALTNMIENALHAMPRGGSLEIRGRLSAGAHAVILEVRDSGVGMDPAALARIFEPYFSTKAVGTGLGLTIAKRNVELHGGTITVESAPGRGTTVHVEIPAAAPALPPLSG